MASSDVCEPELVVAWVRSEEEGVIPLATDIDLPFALSADRRKGSASIPIPRVELGASDLPIQRLLPVVVTMRRTPAHRGLPANELPLL